MKDDITTPSNAREYSWRGIFLWDKSNTFSCNIAAWIGQISGGFIALYLILILINALLGPAIVLAICLVIAYIYSFFEVKLEPKELRALLTQAAAATSRVNEAKSVFARCKEEAATEELLDAAYDNLIATANETVSILELAAKTLDTRCHDASWWTRAWYGRHRNLWGTWFNTYTGLRRDFLEGEAGDFLDVNPYYWEKVTEPVNDERQYICIRYWDEKERLMFIRRWKRVYPNKSVRVILAFTCRNRGKPTKFSPLLETEEELNHFVLNGVHFNERGVCI